MLRKTALSHSLQVVVPLLTKVVNVLNPVDIARECCSRHLISWEDFQGFQQRSGFIRHSELNAELLFLLFPTGNDGYQVFKEILALERPTHAYGRLLERIESRERQSLLYQESEESS